MTERFAALKASEDPNRLDFFANDQPKCPHCGEECHIGENDWWKLYEEGEHDVTCPECDEDFTVSTSVSYSFSTDTADRGD